ncbi:hypothetical protein F5890DRAFT_1447838 [Lentinula detonsa]|uniref:Uncharacterized protein n=1 Tax=Lentinula detonsa TaxID=2804962 RepID=A0AA38UNT5_9AGAR|nr:hypothetical protein F5890DRAFT_1447838 [Lentinula detonsa]
MLLSSQVIAFGGVLLRLRRQRVIPITRFNFWDVGIVMLTSFTSMWQWTACFISQLVFMGPLLLLNLPVLWTFLSHLWWLELWPPSSGPCERASGDQT